MSKFLKLIFGLVVCFVILAIGALFYASQYLQPVDPNATEKVDFVIPKGQSITTIGNRLTEAHLIRHPLAFKYIVWKEGLSSKIQAGTFQLSPAESVGQIAHELTEGTNDTWIKVLEGWRVEEIAEMLEKQDLPEFKKAEFLSLAKDQEGYLYPDSYLVPKTADAKFIYNLLHDTFEKKVTQGLEKEIDASGRDFAKIMVMSSIVQRESRDFDEMQIIAGILWKRNDLPMALNADATLQYLKGYNKAEQSWWTPPLAVDKESTSLFNTYKYPGLPPHPICNPGLEAIRATVTPQETPYWYYLHDLKGGVHYAKTLEEHNQNVTKYLR